MDQTLRSRHVIAEFARVEEAIRRSRAIGQTEGPDDVGLTALITRRDQLLTLLHRVPPPSRSA